MGGLYNILQTIGSSCSVCLLPQIILVQSIYYAAIHYRDTTLKLLAEYLKLLFLSAITEWILEGDSIEFYLYVFVWKCIWHCSFMCECSFYIQEQYILCHEILSDYVDSFDTYANFKELV